MKNTITRRGLLGALTATSAAACSPTTSTPFTASTKLATGTFSHGIASGDPLGGSVILWTRITPNNPTAGPVEVIWEMDKDENFGSLSASGTFTTNAARDWTVKVDATDLDGKADYFYRFRVGDTVSPIGRTKTLPQASVNSARFAVVSCANWEHGFFNAYDHIARQDHFDAVIHLGDYYYEYGAGVYATGSDIEINRRHVPEHEIVSLEDYRLRHGQYRSDPGLQGVTAKMPMIAIWDDHETSNDSWKGGAENHDDSEGSWEARRQAALRAYYEWMPIREPRAGHVRKDIFRSYDWGDLLTLVTVETRLTARAEPLIIEDYFDEIDAVGNADKFIADVLRDPSREMFGQAQEDFVIDALKTSKENGTAWRIMANQVIMGRLLTTDMAPYIDEDALSVIEKDWAGVRESMALSKYNLPIYPDSWDGYPIARENFYQRLIKEGVQDIVVLTGDAHEFWLNDLTSEAGEKVGVECVTTSVSSKTLTAYLGEATADYSLLLTQSNPDARYYNALHNGYIDFSLTRRHAAIRMMAVSTVKAQDYEVFEAARFTLKPYKGSVKVSSPKGLNLKQRALFSGLG
ncbi:MAG: alkaline phosphatase D family protein [Hellea sp.]